MAVPFRRVSKTRKRKRRTHFKLAMAGVTKCSNCGSLIRSHRICPTCGHYAGKEIIEKQ